MYRGGVSTYGRAAAPPVAPVVLYGTRWCAQSQRVRRYLERLGVPYEWVDLEQNPDAANRLRWLTGGAMSHPTAYVDGQLLIEPTLQELDRVLARSR